MSSNIDHIKNSLHCIEVVFKGLEDYRILGSILVAAINNQPHRELHDIDLLIDERIFKEVTERFERLGFKKVTKHAPGFSWNEFQKAEHLTFGVLLKGRFNEDYFEYKPSQFLSIRIDSEYLKPTNYELYRITIRGLPLRSIYEGIEIANLNSKRRIDKQVVYRKMGSNLPKGLSLNQAFHVKILGLEVPYLYTVLSQVYNLVGGARIRLGQSYDPWK